jgi:hypothetical protein
MNASKKWTRPLTLEVSHRNWRQMHDALRTTASDSAAPTHCGLVWCVARRDEDPAEERLHYSMDQSLQMALTVLRRGSATRAQFP